MDRRMDAVEEKAVHVHAEPDGEHVGTDETLHLPDGEWKLGPEAANAAQTLRGLGGSVLDVPEGAGGASREAGSVADDIILWTDTETTGLDESEDYLLQVSIIPTDITGKTWLTDEPFAGKLYADGDEYTNIRHHARGEVQRMHNKSGVWEDLKRYTESSFFNYEYMDLFLFTRIDRLLQDVPHRKVYMGGNSITLDRNFMRKYLPLTYSLYGHRSVDVTSIAIFGRTFGIPEPPEKKFEHDAVSDIKESIQQYVWYLDSFAAR